MVNINVLSNDSDVDGDTLTVSTATAPNGSVAIQSDQTLNYTPNADFNGTDTISYSIDDGNSGTASSSVNVTITAVNDAPVATADSQTTNEDTLVNLNVLSNDSDVDGDTLTVSTATAPNGSVAIQSDQTLNYTPNPNFNGTDTISYSIDDGNSGTASSSVGVSITAVNDAPVLNNNTVALAENSENATSVVTMAASDIDSGDSQTYSITINSGGIFGINSGSGEITVIDNSNLNYEQDTNHTITVQSTDSGALFDTATVTVNVTNVVENATPTKDTAFGSSGTAGSNSFSKMRYDSPNDVISDASGKMIVVGKNNFSGNTTDISITRFNTDGSLDRAFGYQGVVNHDLGLMEDAIAVGVDSADNIIVVGSQYNGTINEVFVARYKSTGILDTSFNSTGYRVTSYGYDTKAADVKIDSSDNILVASTIGSGGGGFRVIKFATNGASHEAADATFVSGPDVPTSLLLQSDGMAVITGYVANGATQNDFAAARFDVSGTPSLDSGTGGYAGGIGAVTFDFGSSTDDLSYDSYINSSDDVIMVGSAKPVQGEDFAALKVSSTGILDIASFASGSSGLLIVDIDGDAGAGTNKSIGKAVLEDSSGNLFFGIDKGNSSVDSILYKTNSSGDVDSVYGSSGQVTFDNATTNNPVSALVKDSTDKIILLTKTTPSTSSEPDLLIARFMTDGTLDTDFNTNGYNVFDPTFSTDDLSQIIELTVSPNVGKFVAIGSSESNKYLIVARYNSDGSIDESFGSNGYYIKKDVEISFTGKGVVELPDGRLAIAGGTSGSGFISLLTNSGTLDNTFAVSGEYKTTSIGLTFNAIKVDGSHLVAGGNSNNSGTKDIYLTRMDFNGNLDNTFGTNGVAVFDLTPSFSEEETVKDIAVLSDSSIITVGEKHYVEGEPRGLIAKVTSAGVLDTAGFAASDGFITVDLDPVGSFNQDTLNAVKVKSNGDIVAAGFASGNQTEQVVIQLNSNGTLDTSFDTDGIVSHNYGSGNAASLALALDASDNILITGYNTNGTDEDIVIARILSSGAKDTLFNLVGGILFDYGSNERASAILIRSDGTLIIAGADNLNLFPTSFFYLQKINLVEP